MKKAITLLSGGLDSFISTHIARSKGIKIALALTFDYGQRAAKREILAAKKICGFWKIRHKVIKLPWLKEITCTALVNKKFKLPTPSLPSPSRGEGKGGGDKRTAAAVWVPNRNGVFINIAASFAETFKAGLIITGFNKEEATTFPDNSKRFVRSMNETLKYGTLRLAHARSGQALEHPQVKSYTQSMDKRAMIKYAVKNKLPLDICWPCYEGGKKLCGKCESCVRFFNALMPD